MQYWLPAAAIYFREILDSGKAARLRVVPPWTAQWMRGCGVCRAPSLALRTECPREINEGGGGLLRGDAVAQIGVRPAARNEPAT
jgi:hypothetical protein